MATDLRSLYTLAIYPSYDSQPESAASQLGMNESDGIGRDNQDK